MTSGRRGFRPSTSGHWPRPWRQRRGAIAIPSKIDLAGNGLLSVLVEDDRDHLAGRMTAVDLAADTILHRAGDEVVDTWFPLGAALAAFCLQAEGGEALDVALVGREGAIGGIVSDGQVPAYTTAVVRAPGRFVRIKTAALEAAKLHSIALRHWFARYSDCLLAQVFQTAACNATHTIRQRTARLLLGAMARTGQADVAITQDQLADMLGVGRSFVTRVIGEMRQHGVVETRRGAIVICEEARLRRISCGCTTAIEDHFDKVLRGIYPRPECRRTDPATPPPPRRGPAGRAG
jgi:CRP-like cAMP-binding protein